MMGVRIPRRMTEEYYNLDLKVTALSWMKGQD